MPTDITLLILDLLGVFFFGVSGSLLAARKGFDMIGSLLLASLVGLGGGVVRDVILGLPLPTAFGKPIYLVPCIMAMLLVYALFNRVQRFTTILTLFDAGGLALFCITGTLKALNYGANPAAAILLGVTTAVGGGVLRDITANEVPSLFNNKDIYAVPAFAGAALTTLSWHLHGFNVVTALAIAGIVFVFRVTAWQRGWHVPLAVHGRHRQIG